jgi:SAM-dependent methyltransferase
MNEVRHDEQAVHHFWEEMAREHGTSDLATAPDHYYRELEVARILPHIEGGSIIDVGCGNGWSTLQFAAPGRFVLGVDYSAQMIKQAFEAHKAAQPRPAGVHFLVGDVRNLSVIDAVMAAPVDTIISERCLINLADWAQQQEALLEMKHYLKPGGKIILVENFMDGLRNLNELRARLGLHEIAVRWHNHYLEMGEFMPFAEEHFRVEEWENIGNLYYLMSRVLYAKLAAMEGIEPQYGHPINQIAAQLPSLGDYNYSANWLIVLRPR